MKLNQQCTKCNTTRAMHEYGDGQMLCCKCHIANGCSPADWHPICMNEFNKLHPVIQKFNIGDRVKIIIDKENSSGKYFNQKAIIKGSFYDLYGGTNLSKKSYSLVFDKFGEAAWFDEDQIELLPKLEKENTYE